MQILNKPKCRNFDKCGNEAMTLVNNMWLCGECVIKLQNKISKLKERLILEENFDG